MTAAFIQLYFGPHSAVTSPLKMSSVLSRMLSSLSRSASPISMACTLEITSFWFPNIARKGTACGSVIGGSNIRSRYCA
ncbi:hypothetical protein D3C71_2014160 [compost metagenome]